ncbi:MAG: ATP-binding protein, partial [Oceanobacter sp.]
MFLKKFIYVNWGNIPATEFEFGPINLLSGGNGSGKTTAADAIQTIMTAAHDTLFNYNPGQDEATQRGRGKQVRTLASYVLGCDDGSYARPDGAIGYLGAVFHPTKNEPGEPFTALIGVSASLDKAGPRPVPRQNDIQFYIVAGEQLSRADLLQTDLDGQQRVVPLKRLKSWLEQRLGNGANKSANIEEYGTKKLYLKRLYGALRGQFDSVSEREAMHAARAFSRFMAYKPVKSINGFVAQEILEPRDLGDAIRSVSDLMKTIHGMETEANALTETLKRLQSCRDSNDRYIHEWLELQTRKYTATRGRYLQEQNRWLSAKAGLQAVTHELALAEQERFSAQEKRTTLREQLISMEARRMGIGALQDKDSAEKAIESAKEKLHQQAIPLLEQDDMLRASLRASELINSSMQRSGLVAELPALGQKSLKDLARQVLAFKEDGI